MKILLSTLALVAGICHAQGPHGPRGGMTGASNLNMAKVQTVAGAVTAVNIGYGMEYPSITVNKLQIKIAPVWYLLDEGFEIKAGDSVGVTAAPSTLASDSYLYAVEIANLTTKLRIALRDSSGVPLWTGGNRGGRFGEGPMAAGGCLDASTIASASGVIDKIAIGAGIQMPTLTLKTAAGALLAVKLGPERILLAADIQLKAGDSITVRYASETCTDELVALSITTASGAIIRLRDDDCMPAWQ